MRYQGKNYWLSNFYPVLVYIFTADGKAKIPCNSVESAFHALRTTNDSERYRISQMHPLEAKKYAFSRQLPARADSLKVMYQLLRQKFNQTALKQQLMECDDSYFIFENSWHDNFWGMCTCQGNRCLGHRKHNHLGKLLKSLKYELIREERQKKQQEGELASPAKEEDAPKEIQVAEELEEQLKPIKKTKPRKKPTAKKAAKGA